MKSCDYKYRKCVQVADLHYYKNDQMNRVYGADGSAPTLVSVSGGGRQVKVENESRYRYLTPKEYFRLMGFDDADYDKVAAAGMSKTQCYKMAGNSICVPVLESLFPYVLPYLKHE